MKSYCWMRAILSFLKLFFYLFHLLYDNFKWGSWGRISQSTWLKQLYNSFISVVWYPYMMLLIITNHTYDLGSWVFLVRNLTCHHFPHQNSKTVDIWRTIILPSIKNLRGHPMWSSYPNIFTFFFTFSLSNPRKTKIT